MKFEEMNIEESVLNSLNRMGFENPTRIQSETIPLIKGGHDVIGQSETGSGKTAAFGIPLVEKVIKGNRIQALVLAPTRELSLQIASDLEGFSSAKGLRIQAIYGGVSMEPQVSGLKSAEIVVGTPGRVLDHMRRGTMDTANLGMFVLDEADKMIDMGFISDIRAIERNIPKNRQTLLFSATMPRSLTAVRDGFTRNARKVKTESKVSDSVLKQFYYNIDQSRKFSLLAHLVREEKPELAIIFCNSRRDADALAANLQGNGIAAVALHGGLTQKRRESVLEAFHRGATKVLVATDIAARGLDVRNVTHVFNYGIPKSAEDYANRIGRTARAGETGKAISLLTTEDHGPFRAITNVFSYVIQKAELPHFALLPFIRHQGRGGRNFGNGSRRFFRRTPY